MLPKKHRIKKEDFKRIFKNSTAIHSQYFTLLYHINTELKSPQFAVVASTKVGKATIRNKVKRRIREILSARIPNLDPNQQIVVICKPKIVSLSFKDLEKELNSALKKKR